MEPHADIIVKGSRDVDYGHKLNLTTGRSGLILDLVDEAGNPADSERLLPMLERHIAFYSKAPLQAVADGGFASRVNLAGAKARGVRDMAFHKKAGLRIEDMVRSHWVYRKLRNFRAGIEAVISRPEARLRPVPLHMAWARPLQGLCLAIGGRLQSRPLRPPQAGLTPNHQRHRLQANRRALAGHPCLNSLANPTHRRARQSSQQFAARTNPIKSGHPNFYNKNNSLWTNTS